MRRALTLVEILLALTLLTAIIAATTTWTQIAGRLSGSVIEPTRMRTAAQAALQVRVGD